MAGFSAVIATQIYLYYRSRVDLYNHNLEIAAVIQQTLSTLGQQIDIEPPSPGQMFLMELLKSKMGEAQQQERDLQGKFA
jgi:hypothetical protein